MAEYYPLLAKAVGSLSNSTPESRRIVYERARKALIGQLRTLHPPVPDDDIDQESEALDRAIERLEGELATGSVPAVVLPNAPVPPAPAPPSVTTPPMARQGSPEEAAASSAEAAKLPVLPLRSRLAGSKPGAGDEAPPEPSVAVPALVPGTATEGQPASLPSVMETPSGGAKDQPSDTGRATPEPKSIAPRVRTARDGPRPIAPQPPSARAPKRRLWIIPVAVGVVVALVGYFAWKLRDRPEAIAIKSKPAEQTQVDSGKIAERIGETPSSSTTSGTPKPSASTTGVPAAQPQSPAPASTDASSQQAAAPAPSNPELPVAHRAALLVEAPSEPNKVKTFLGTVVWKLNNVPQGPNDAVGLAVEADIEIPDDKMKVVVTFAKNTEASLPASHTINIHYTIDGGSYTGDVKQISVPQMRPEASAAGEPLAGVTVQIVPNSFLVGLSPGNAEAANTDLIRRLQWVDIPMLLDNGKIAKLTFEKSDSGQRDLTEALDAWQKP